MHAPIPRPIYPHADIVRAVAAAVGCTADTLKGRRGGLRIVYARQAAAWMMRHYCRPQPAYRTIGERLGLTNHTSVMSACRAVETVPERYEEVITAATQWLVAAQRGPEARAVALAMQEHPGDPVGFVERLRRMGYVVMPECDCRHTEPRTRAPS